MKFLKGPCLKIFLDVLFSECVPPRLKWFSKKIRFRGDIRGVKDFALCYGTSEWTKRRENFALSNTAQSLKSRYITQRRVDKNEKIRENFVLSNIARSRSPCLLTQHRVGLYAV